MIVGFNIEAIMADKGHGGNGDIQVNYQPEIKSVEKDTVSALDEPVARINYEFSVNYMAGEEKAAHITMTGHVFWKGDVEEITEAWEEDNEIPDKVEVPLMNEMYKKLLSESVGVADTLNLLPPIPTPKINQQ